MKVTILQEAGHEEALLGLSLNHSLDRKYLDRAELIDHMEKVARKLAQAGAGHRKFLESIYLWLDVTAPRYWWQEADTYRMSTKQSESTMNTILKRPLVSEDFQGGLPEGTLHDLLILQAQDKWKRLKQMLPESFLQRRIWVMNYSCLRNIFEQRKNHRLTEWQKFLACIRGECQHPDYLPQ